MSHDAGHGHASKPYANPLGIFVGLIILWVVSGGLIWALLRLILGGGEPAE